MTLRSLAICPTCSEIYSSHRRCPTCDGDAHAAEELEAARQAIAAASEAARAPHRRRGSLGARSILAMLSVSLVAGTVALFVTRA